MSEWKYRKPEPSNIQGPCVICLIRPQKRKLNKFHPYCGNCQKKLYGKGVRASINKRIDAVKRPYRKYVKSFCEQCGFIPEHICQLDVDHIDKNHKNNAPENLQTLCANCHRLKTYRER